MKSLLEFIIKNATAYLTDLFSLVTRPKTFILGKVEILDQLDNAITFLLLTIICALILCTPTAFSEQNLLLVYLKVVIFNLAVYFTVSLSIVISFKIVRGSSTMLNMFIATSYFISVLSLIIIIVGLISEGFTMVIDSENIDSYKKIMNLNLSGGTLRDISYQQYNKHMNGLIGMIVIITSCILFISTLAWQITCWGAFRIINKVSKTRSTVAFILYYIINSIIFYPTMFIYKSLGIPLY